MPEEQASKLLFLLRSRGRHAFQAFYDACKKTGLWDAADILNPDGAPHVPESDSPAVLTPADLSDDEDLPDCKQGLILLDMSIPKLPA